MKKTESENTVKVSFEAWLAALDLVIESIDSQIKDNRFFVWDTELIMAVDDYIRDPQKNLAPLIALRTRHCLEGCCLKGFGRETSLN